MIALLTAVNTALTGNVTLAAKATSGMHQDQAPPKTAPPFVTFYLVPGPGPEYTFGGTEAFDEVLIVAKGVAQDADDGSAAGTDLAEEMRELIKATLHNANLTVTGYQLLSIMCDQPVLFHENVAGRTRYHRGDHYRVQLQKT